MEIEKLAEIVGHAWHELPHKIVRNLADVDVLVCRDPAHAAATLAEEYEDIDADGIPVDCKGVFVGEPMEVEESDETEEGEVVLFPNGSIVMVASNIANDEEAILVFLHEAGHALGLDEEEVKQLGLGVSSERSPEVKEISDAQDPAIS
jgi:predicted Zn-dependent protease with MMP-like domain